jgi:hypothetical protein
MIQPQETSSFSGGQGARTKVPGPRFRVRGLRADAHGPPCTVHGARPSAPRPQNPRPTLHRGDVTRTSVLGPRSTDQRPQTSAHSVQGRHSTGPGPRTSVLGPKLRRPLSGNAETVEDYCALATSPNANRASKNWRPNKIGACLQQGPPKKGGGGPAGGVFAGMERLQLPPKLGGPCLGWPETRRCMADGTRGLFGSGQGARTKAQGPSTQCHNAVVVASRRLRRGPWLCRAGLAEWRFMVLGPWISVINGDW